MQLNPTLFFNGASEEALEHYRDALGGTIEIVRYAGTPAASGAPAEWSTKVLYGALHSPLGIVNAMDAPPQRAGAPGDNFAISIQTDTEEQTDAIFAKLCIDGTVTMPLEQTFFSPKFGMVTDKFGIKWMVNYAAAQQ